MADLIFLTIVYSILYLKAINLRIYPVSLKYCLKNYNLQTVIITTIHRYEKTHLTISLQHYRLCII